MEGGTGPAWCRSHDIIVAVLSEWFKWRCLLAQIDEYTHIHTHTRARASAVVFLQRGFAARGTSRAPIPACVPAGLGPRAAGRGAASASPTCPATASRRTPCVSARPRSAPKLEWSHAEFGLHPLGTLWMSYRTAAGTAYPPGAWPVLPALTLC